MLYLLFRLLSPAFREKVSDFFATVFSLIMRASSAIVKFLHRRVVLIILRATFAIFMVTFVVLVGAIFYWPIFRNLKEILSKDQMAWIFKGDPA